MKQAATLLDFVANHLNKVYERHPAFAGRKARFKALATFLLLMALCIISYSSTFLFS